MEKRYIGDFSDLVIYEQAHKKASEDEKVEFGEEAFNSEVGETRDVLAQNRGHKNIAKSDEETLIKQDIPLSVKAIILDEYGRLLLLRNNSQYSKFEFDLPGGHVGEKSLIACKCNCHDE